MKTIKTILTAMLMAALFAQGACAAVEEPQVLKDLLAQAEKNNPLISAEHQKVLRAEAAITEATAKMGPKAGAAYGALWQSDALLSVPGSIKPTISAMGIDLNPLDSKNVYAAALGFTQTIYAGGSLRANKEAKKLARDATLAEEMRVRQNVDNAVRVTYYNRKRAEAKETVAREALKLAEDHQSRAQKLFNGGIIAKADVLRAKVAVADANLSLIRANNAVKLSLTALERAVGAPVDESTLKGNAVTKSEKKIIHTETQAAETEAHLKYAYENRPEISMYSLLSKQATQMARVAKGQLLPQVGAGGLLSTVDDSVIPGSNNEFRFGVGAYWRLLDSGEMHAKASQAKAQAKELLYRLDDMKNAIRMDVRQAELNLRSAETRLTVASRQVDQAEEDYRIAVKRYNAHVGTNLDMLDARVALINSRTELVDAIYDIETAKANLIYAMGE